MNEWGKKARCKVFGHMWGITGCNGFGHASEEKCADCGEYRHKIHNASAIGREEWKPGKHPKSK